MEQSLVHLVHFAAWTFVIIFILAFIGLVAIIRWVMNLFRRGEAAAERGIERVEGAFKR